MSGREHLHGAWIAGLIEHRVALGVAATASILLVVLLVAQPGGQSAKQGMHSTNEQSGTIRQNDSKQARTNAPRYSIPDKSPARPKLQVANPAPVIKPITPSTLPEPARIPPQAATVKTPPPAKAVTLTKAIPDKSSAGARIRKPSKPVPTSTQTATQASKAAAMVFFVQVAAYRERSSAQQQAASLLQKGWNSMVKANAKGWYTVRIGPVSSRAAAGRLRQQLLDKAKLKGFVVQG